MAEWTKPSAGPLTPEWVQPNVLDNLNALREDTVAAQADLAAQQASLTSQQASLTSQQASLTSQQASLTSLSGTVAGISGVPAGLIAAVATAAGIPAGWTRYTNGDGRLLVGAGTTFGQPFTENTAVGSNWTPYSGFSFNTPIASDQVNVTPSGATAVSTASHQHTISSSAQTWTPVARVVVHVIKS